ncbi:MAG: hypothetical protein HZA77_04075 [Candidatus Schekmanbacteria bacterium]|nr:hypothetical protein [Candidatus Schekmanbacteria bacterium]
MKTVFKGKLYFCTLLFLLSIIALPIANAKTTEATGLDLTNDGEASLRIGALGGTLKVEDPLSPLYGSSLNIPLHAYRSDDGKYGFVHFQAQGSTVSDTAGVVSDDGTTLTVSNDASTTGSLLSTRPGNVMVLYYDADSDGAIDQFPAYLIGPANISGNKIVVAGSLPTAGIIQIIQIVETPEFAIQTLVSPFKWPTKIDGVKRNVMSVGVPAAVSINDSANAGFVKVGKKKVNVFDEKVDLTIPYNKDLITALGIDPATLTDTLKVYSLSGNDFSSVKVGSVDTSAGTVTAKIKHLSIYQVVMQSSDRNSISYIQNVSAKAKGSKAAIKYRLADASGKSSDVKIEYRKLSDPGSGWVEIKTESGVKPGNRKVKWDVSGLDTGHYQVKVTPTKNIDGTDVAMTSTASPTFYVKNGGAGASSPSITEATVDNSSLLPQVTLSWDPESSASSYNIYRQVRFSTGGFDKTLTSIDNTTGTIFTDTTLSSSFYEAVYQVTSVDAGGRESLFTSLKKQLKLASEVLSGYGGYYYGG